MGETDASAEEEAIRVFDARYRWVLRMSLRSLRERTDLMDSVDLDDPEVVDDIYEMLSQLVRQEAGRDKIEDPDQISALAERFISKIADELVRSGVAHETEVAPADTPTA